MLAITNAQIFTPDLDLANSAVLIAPGHIADLTLLTPDLHVHATITQDHITYCKP